MKIDLVIQKSEGHKLCGMIAIETEQNRKDLEKYYIPYGLLFFSSRWRYQDSFQFYFRFKRVSEMVLIDFC